MAKAKWNILPQRPVSWTMKLFSSAETSESVLRDGRLELHIQHDVIRGVTPQMLAWWFRNIEGEMELGGQMYPRYLVWHPIDHISFKVVKRLPDGSVGVGSQFHIVEAFGGDMRHLLDQVFHVQQLDDTGIVLETHVMGRAVLRLHEEFVPVEGGTQYNVRAILGLSSWIGRAGLNRIMLPRRFPSDKRKAWLKHNVEEVGNFQFFLPELHREAGQGDGDRA